MPAGSALRAALGAVAFLTRVPVGRGLSLGAEDVARGAVLFPLVGAGVGAIVGGSAALLHPRLPALAAAGVAVGLELLLTGAMHVDALADTADALGARSRARALEIMRDPRIGAYGAAAVAIDLIIKVAAVAALLESGAALASLVTAGALARAAPLPLAVVLPYARPGDGLGERIGMPAAGTGIALACGVAVGLRGGVGAAMLGAAAAAVVLLGLCFRRRFGGVTGDALGAATELAGTVALLGAVALR